MAIHDILPQHCTQSVFLQKTNYSYDYGGHIGKKTFYNIEDFLREEPKKYL